MDPKDLLDPVNVLALFPADLDERLSSTKWKDRVEVLEECNKVLAQPQNAKIAENNADAYGSLASTLGAKCKSDANINVVIEAAKVIEGLARGFGKAFGRHRAAVMVGCLERLKERKASVVEALGKALDAVASTVSRELTSSRAKLRPGTHIGHRRGRPHRREIEESPGTGRHAEIPIAFPPIDRHGAEQRAGQADGGDASGSSGRQCRARPFRGSRMSRYYDENHRRASF